MMFTIWPMRPRCWVLSRMFLLLVGVPCLMQLLRLPVPGPGVQALGGSCLMIMSILTLMISLCLRDTASLRLPEVFVRFLCVVGWLFDFMCIMFDLEGGIS